MEAFRYTERLCLRDPVNPLPGVSQTPSCNTLLLGLSDSSAVTSALAIVRRDRPKASMPSWWSAKASYTRAAEAKDETAAEYTCDEHLMSLAELASRRDTPATLCTAPPAS